MKLNRVFVGLFFIVVLLVIMNVRKRTKVNVHNHLCTIGILQTASHPALDAACEGFMAEIREKMGDRVDFVVRNGEGSVANIHAIAQQFHAKDDIDGVFAIATPAAQAMMSVEKNKPIGIAAVSVSPELGGVFSAKNIYGVSDMINVRAEVEAMKALLPSIMTVGILYCTAEINSVSVSKIMVDELKKVDCVPLLIGVTSEADIAPALTSALRKVDAVLAPTDNIIAGSITLITDIMSKAHKPLIVSDNMLVQYGALMSRGVDFYESGRQAGKMALRIFVDKQDPSTLSIVSAESKEIFVNKRVLESLDIIIPESLEGNSVLV